MIKLKKGKEKEHPDDQIQNKKTKGGRGGDGIRTHTLTLPFLATLDQSLAATLDFHSKSTGKTVDSSNSGLQKQTVWGPVRPTVNANCPDSTLSAW